MSLHDRQRIQDTALQRQWCDWIRAALKEHLGADKRFTEGDGLYKQFVINSKIGDEAWTIQVRKHCRYSFGYGHAASVQFCKSYGYGSGRTVTIRKVNETVLLKRIGIFIKELDAEGVRKEEARDAIAQRATQDAEVRNNLLIMLNNGTFPKIQWKHDCSRTAETFQAYDKQGQIINGVIITFTKHATRKYKLELSTEYLSVLTSLIKEV